MNSSTNGYIWHTTGSGKTLTSFKCATILRDEGKFDKILFVVDRKDLDKQTVDEFNKFEKECVDKTENTKKLSEHLANDNMKSKVIVTTLQKLSRFLEKKSPILDLVKDKKIVFIFDECHRSQFGESNKAIRETFTNYRLIGFTGTPIFEENASASNKVINEHDEAEKQTTEHIFDLCLHRYLIKDAIDDNNVLSFHVDYYKEIEDKFSETQEKKLLFKLFLRCIQMLLVKMNLMLFLWCLLLKMLLLIILYLKNYKKIWKIPYLLRQFFHHLIVIIQMTLKMKKKTIKMLLYIRKKQPLYK